MLPSPRGSVPTVTGLIDTWQRSSVENQYYFLAMLRLWLCFDVLVLAVRCVHHDVALLLSLARLVLLLLLLAAVTTKKSHT